MGQNMDYPSDMEEATLEKIQNLINQGAVVVAGAWPVDPEAQHELLGKIPEHVVGVKIPTPKPDDIHMACSKCGCQIIVGTFLQKVLAMGAVVACMDCSMHFHPDEIMCASGAKTETPTKNKSVWDDD